VIAGVQIFDTIAASLCNILIWNSICGSALYKRNIQNRKIQSKKVLGLMKYREQRNHGLKYESDCVHIGIGIKIFMNHGSFYERLFC
jgi:hypothetical protein